MRVPELIAHRGYAAHYPENTLLALRAAVDAGAHWLEFDVQLSADAVPVLLHDANLQRTAGRPETVFDLSAQQLSAINVGEPTRFGDKFPNAAIATLAEFAAWFSTTRSVQAFVEIKTESIQRFGVERVHRAVWSALEPVRDRCVLISYDDAFLFAARIAAPTRIGWVMSRWDADQQQRARALAPDYLFTNWTRLPSEPESLWSGDWQWAVYEVVDPDQALAVAARGIALVESMAIGELLADSRLQPGQT
jgi:glycerophosphoryl diester phosphodiesterase